MKLQIVEHENYRENGQRAEYYFDGSPKLAPPPVLLENPKQPRIGFPRRLVIQNLRRNVPDHDRSVAQNLLQNKLIAL